MSESQRVTIERIATGVPGLDAVLGGGIPQYSFNLIAGAPGTGKTTIAQQILFSNATRERPGLFFTVLGEPPLKMLRYQQQYRFFDPARVGSDIHFLNLSDEVLQQDLDAVLQRITTEVERTNPGFVVVDSFRSVVRAADGARATEIDLQYFVQRLALRLTSWEVTSFLIGEFGGAESRDPVFTVADGVFWLMNEVERNASVRKLRVTKVRGQPPLPGLHTMRITDTGVEVFPRLPKPMPRVYRNGPARLSTGIPLLDSMMGGGIPRGDSVLVTGPTGAGKTALATQFAAAGIRNGEKTVIAVFEENPQTYLARAKSLGLELDDMVAAGTLDVMYLRPLDLSVDETLREILERVNRLNATQVVIDSLSGFEVALAPSFREDFQESFYRLIFALTSLGITVLSTVEIVETSDYLRFSPFSISFLTDDIIALRYIELEGAIQKVIGVIKMRGSDHSPALRSYAITAAGVEIRRILSDYRGIITGVPEKTSQATLGGPG